MQRNALSKVITIQSIMRSIHIQNKYKINQLTAENSTDYSTFVIGNDPKMPAELNNYHEFSDKIALVATSGMRAVSLACKLGNSVQTPKIILVDNSLQVIAFWKAMQIFMQDEHQTVTENLFKENFPKFLYKHRHL